MTERVEDGGPSLLPCPFCGGRRIETNYIRDGRSIGCRDCGASLHQFNGRTDIYERLAKAWNRRTPQPSGNSGEFAPARQMGLDVGGANG